MFYNLCNFINKFPWIINLAVGSFVFIIYKKQQNDSKRDLAKLIIQEVRYAEQLIKNASDIGYTYSLANRVLPTNSWNKNIHLFINNLNQSDVDTISKFYSNASYLDDLISHISEMKNNMLIPIKEVQNNCSLFREPAINIENPTDTHEKSGMPSASGFYQSLSKPLLTEVSSKIEYIYNTPAIDKLRYIANKKWFQI